MNNPTPSPAQAARLFGFRRFLRDYFYVVVLIVGGLMIWQSLFPGKPDLPEKAPAFQLVALDGTPINSADLAGKTVVLNFWATWCGPCISEIPVMNRIAREHPEVALIGVSMDDGSQKDLEKAVDKMGLGYPVARYTSQIRADYDVSVLPTTVIIDGDGRVKTAFVGAVSTDALESVL